MKVQPYLFFEGRCEEAIEFYKKVLGAQVTALMRYKDNPDPSHNPPGSDNKVMHASFRIGETECFASDGNCSQQAKFAGFSLSITAADAKDAERLFAGLGDGGQVQMPMAETFFATRFGMVADKFGVSWMVIAGK